MKPAEAQLARAQYEAEQAKKRLASTMGALQYRLKPGTLMNNAWEGVRDKSSDLTDGALQAVKERPGAASGVVAAVLIYLAREEDDGRVVADLSEHSENYDLTAPTVERSMNEGVNA